MNNFVKSILALCVTSTLVLPSVTAATYEIIRKGQVVEDNKTSHKLTYSQQGNNLGESAIVGTNTYNFPVQAQYLSDEFLNLLENPDAMTAGTPIANDLSLVLAFLQGQTPFSQANASNPLVQKMGSSSALINFGNNTEKLKVFDLKWEDIENSVPFSNPEQLTHSTTDFINGITDDWIYGRGSAPYLPLDFTPSTLDDNDEVIEGDKLTYFFRDFSSRGFFSSDKGVTIHEVVPEESRFGGESSVLDISNNIAVGYSSTKIPQDIIDLSLATSQEDVGNLSFNLGSEEIPDFPLACANEDVLKAAPFEECMRAGISFIQNALRITKTYNTQAYQWTLGANGNYSAKALGNLITEQHPDDIRDLVSVAQAVNTHGVAVGFATGWVDENETDPSVNESTSLYAVVFKNGLVTDFTDDHSEYFESKAYDINDNGIAVGHVTTLINSSPRTKFYYVDTDAEPMKMVMPEGFFKDSASTARAVNNQGLIVGEGEVETHNDSSINPRRRHGFLYDINTESFTNLNSFLPCDSDYTIIEARGINDNNEIFATALYKEPSRNSIGELITDDNGDQLFEDTFLAVTMIPISGEIEKCNRVVEPLVRKGAGFGFISLFFLTLITFRRRLINHY